MSTAVAQHARKMVGKKVRKEVEEIILNVFVTRNQSGVEISSTKGSSHLTLRIASAAPVRTTSHGFCLLTPK